MNELVANESDICRLYVGFQQKCVMTKRETNRLPSCEPSHCLWVALDFVFLVVWFAADLITTWIFYTLWGGQASCRSPWFQMDSTKIEIHRVFYVHL